MYQGIPPPTTESASNAPNSTNLTEGGGSRGGTDRRGHGCGDGRNGRGGGGGGRGGRDHTRKPRPPRTPHSHFKGETSDMNGQVFQCHSESADAKQFSVTLEKL